MGSFLLHYSPYIKSKYYNLCFFNIDGVSIFFVLSSYLIVTIVFREISYINLNYNNFLKKFVGTISITSYTMYLLNFILILGYCIHFSKWFLRSIVDYFNLRFNYEKNYFFPDIINWVFFWVLCIALSFLTYNVIKKPFLNIRNIIFNND